MSNSNTPSYLEDISTFQFQQEPWTCWPTCIKNIMGAFHKKYLDCPNPSLSKINKTIITFYGMPTTPNMVVRLINEKILKNKGFELKEETDMTYEKLQSLIRNKNTSYPIVTVSPDYFEEIERKIGSKKLGYETHGKTTNPHTLIVLDVNEHKIIFFDPYTPHFHLNKKNAPSRAVFELPKVTFLNLWSDTKGIFRSAMWIRRVSQKTIMEDYGETKR